MFLQTWGDIDERLDPLFYLNMILLNKNMIQQSKHAISTFKQKVNMQRGRFGHRPRNDSRYYGGEYPFIQTGNIVKASTTNKRIEFTQTLNELGLSTSRLFDEKVLIITIAANIGYTAILDYAACFPDSLVALTPKDDSLSLEYLNAYIRFIQKYIENLAPQAAQKNINLKQMSKLPIIVPDLDTQNLIVSIMEKAYTEKVKKEKQSQDLLESINDYLMQELDITMPSEEENTLEHRMFYVSSADLSGGRFDPFYCKKEYRTLEDNIENSFYNNYRLSSIAIFENGVVYSADDEREQGHGILRANNIDLLTNQINLSDIRYIDDSLAISESKKLFANDILMCTASGSKEHAGKVAFIENDVPYYFGGFMSVIRTTTSDCIPRYLFEYLASIIFKTLLYRHLGGTNINNISTNMLNKIKIVLPPVLKQQEIADKIVSIRYRAKLLEQEAAAAVNSAKTQVEKILIGDGL